MYGHGFLSGNCFGYSFGYSSILFWIIALGFGVLFISFLFRQSHSGYSHNQDAYDIAQNRFAKGEISEEEFDKIIKKLK